MLRPYTHLLTGLAFLALLVAFAETTVALEEPEFEVVERFGEWELRRYAPYLVAETRVEGDLRQSGNGAFRVLAGYIFGDNQPGQKMAMTVPVLSAGDASGYRYQFVMEHGHTLETLPVPSDARVELREMPERLVAALRFSGTWNEQRIDDLATGLLEALDRAGFRASAEPLLARYNPPITPWFLRRNEILIEVQARD